MRVSELPSGVWTITLETVVSLLILNYPGNSHGRINGNENAEAGWPEIRVDAGNTVKLAAPFSPSVAFNSFSCRFWAGKFVSK